MFLFYGPPFGLATKIGRDFPKSCSKVAKESKNFFLFLSSCIWSDAKICNLYNKSNISKHFCAILRCNQRREIHLFVRRFFSSGLQYSGLFSAISRERKEQRYV